MKNALPGFLMGFEKLGMFYFSPQQALHKEEVYSEREGLDCTSHRGSHLGCCCSTCRR